MIKSILKWVALSASITMIGYVVFNVSRDAYNSWQETKSKARDYDNASIVLGSDFDSLYVAIDTSKHQASYLKAYFRQGEILRDSKFNMSRIKQRPLYFRVEPRP